MPRLPLARLIRDREPPTTTLIFCSVDPCVLACARPSRDRARPCLGERLASRMAAVRRRCADRRHPPPDDRDGSSPIVRSDSGDKLAERGACAMGMVPERSPGLPSDARTVPSLNERSSSSSSSGCSSKREGRGASSCSRGQPGSASHACSCGMRGGGALGLQVLRARGGELERDFSYGVVRQLFEPRLAALSQDERAQLLVGAARSGCAALRVRRGRGFAHRRGGRLLQDAARAFLADREPR